MGTSYIKEGSGTPSSRGFGSPASANAGGYPKGPRGASGLGGANQGKTVTGAGTAAKGGPKLQQTKSGRGK